ncbi:MAG TPA: polysaccharide pyruvyl transferase family protein [Thermoanaerobaculia bacterium]
MSESTLLLVGYYGFGNTGDEAILASIVAGLRRRAPDARFVVVSGDPADTRRRYGVEAVGWKDPVAISEEARQADLVVVGGGGLFQDYLGFDPGALLTPRHGGISFYAGPAVLAALARKPLALFGLGFGPLESVHARRFTRAVGEAACHISVRDEGSRALLVSAGLESSRIAVSADPAFTLSFEKIYPEDVLAGAGVEPRPPVVGVALRNWSIGVDPAFWEREVATALDLFVERTGGTLLFVPFERSPWASADDFDLAPRIRKRLRHADRAATLTELRHPAETAGLLAGCDLVLGMRLHSLIFAAAGGVPLVGLAYDPKVGSFFERVGASDMVIPLADVTARDLLNLMAQGLEKRDDRRLGLLGASAELRRLAEEDLDRVASLLLQPPVLPPITEDLVTLFDDAVRGNMLQREQASTELEALREAHAELQTRAAELGTALIGADRRAAEAEKLLQAERESHLREKSLLERQAAEARQELNQFKTSRLWKTAHIYWSARRGVSRAKTSAKGVARKLLGRPPSDWAGRNEAHEAIKEAAPLAIENRHDVVCFPIIDWDFRFQRPQQLMKRYAEAGHRVFYIAQRFRPAGQPYEISEKARNVFEVSLRGPEKNVYKDRLETEESEALFQGIDALRRDRSLGATASIVQLPFWSPVARRFRDDCAWPLVYDLMDHHAGFSSNTAAMVEGERELLSSADLVLASSAFLEEQARRQNPHVLRLPNACDYEHFAAVSEPRNTRPVVGYYGAISDWFDAGLVAELARRRPDWDFLLVGSTWGADLGELPKLPNVAMPGEKPYAEIPRWLERFDVAFIPFKVTPLTEATNPVKAYEIFAAGKPLVSVPLPELLAMAPHVRTASAPAEFEKEIEAALRDTKPDEVESRRAFAKENTWARRFETMSAAVAGAFPKASVVVVTYNNRDLNRLCLGSVAARTEWPNYEVLVVDNASSDGTRELLDELRGSDPRIRIIVNEENRGFAAANNAGLAASTGEYLVMLNNDTVVTRGWVTALIRHLAANPKLGLVGSVTNAIANAAKIEVGYTDVAALPAWAAEWVREHDGETFSIPMVAFFCVAMPRRVYETVGPLDERFGIGMFEDNDYNRRVREKGWEIRCARDSFVHHWQKASFRLLGKDAYLALFDENRRKFEQKWGENWKAEGIDLWQRADLGFYRDQLDNVRQRIAAAPGVVVFLPSVGWGIHLFQRPHHLARTFARSDWVSIFDCSNAHDDVNGFKEIEPNLFLFRGPSGVLQQIASPLLWAFPYNFAQKDGYPADARVVYDWIDDLTVFPYDPELLRRNHERGLAEATIVASVARRLHEQALARRSDALYLPNGVEYERFAAEAPLPSGDRDLDAFRAAGRPIAGYYGALAEWFDYELLDEAARLKPDWSFLLIGPMYDQSLLGRPMLNRPNVRWTGPRDYHLLPGYLRLFDVATIPFKINEITTATSPLKLYEYFAAGKPVVTTPMPECMAYPEVAIARNAREFVEALDRARVRGKDPAFRERLRSLGHENSWDARVKAVLAQLEHAGEHALQRA